jgi:hypothetical protein
VEQAQKFSKDRFKTELKSFVDARALSRIDK